MVSGVPERYYTHASVLPDKRECFLDK